MVNGFMMEREDVIDGSKWYSQNPKGITSGN